MKNDALIEHYEEMLTLLKDIQDWHKRQYENNAPKLPSGMVVRVNWAVDKGEEGLKKIDEIRKYSQF